MIPMWIGRTVLEVHTHSHTDYHVGYRLHLDHGHVWLYAIPRAHARDAGVCAVRGALYTILGQPLTKAHMAWQRVGEVTFSLLSLCVASYDCTVYLHARSKISGSDVAERAELWRMT